MVFFSIIRLAKYSAKPQIKLQFFQSSYPYFKSSYYYNNVIKYQRFNNNWWWKSNPYCSARPKRFLTISNGHYGLYYSMFHHDAERKKQQREYNQYIRHYIMKHMAMVDRATYRQQKQRQQHKNSRYHHHYHFRGHHRGCIAHLKLLILGFTALSPSFFDAPVTLENVKKFSSKVISSLNIKYENKPQMTTPTSSISIDSNSTSPSYITGIMSNQNPFTTSFQRYYSTNTTAFTTISAPSSRKNYDHIKVPSIVEFVKNMHTTTVAQERQFEGHFLQTQIDNITSAFNNFKQPQDLNIIYPLYQAIKRNELTLPTIELYNIVLDSIVRRSLDGECTLQAIETKLTNLLTVYQDILSTGLKPNKETYNVVVDSLLDSSLKCVELSPSNPLQYQEIQKKSQEFVQITIELFNSISNQLDLQALLPKLLQVIGNYPELITESVVKPFIPLIKSVEVADKNYYLSVIEISKYFTKFNLLDNREIYSIIESAYDKYKKLEDVQGNEFKVYEAVVTSLIYNNQVNKASQFLDDILLDYKGSLQFELRPTKKQIGNLISAFLKAVIAHTDVNKGYELFMRFSSIPYIPELPVSFYNSIICAIGKQQQPINENDYAIMWKLYDYVAIRKDFQETTTVEMMKQTNVSCRDLLLSISLARGDHERTFQLIKEIMLKNHLIGDLEILQKVLNYLYNGVVYNKQQGEYFNQYYFGLLWNLMESQALHYQVNSIDLNDFLCQFVIYLMINVPAELQHNTLAVQSVVDYNVKLLLNSPLVIKTIEMMDMQTDNLYGLVVISRQLMKYSQQDVELVGKIAEFQALLINQFEDASNYYMELSEEVNEFKHELKHHFANIIPKVTNPTSAMVDACEHLSIEIPGVYESSSNKLDVLQCDLDLSVLLNINYEKGIAKFLELFHLGHKFQPSTWRIVVNFNFLNDILINQCQIKIDKFIERIWMCNKEYALALMEQMVDYDIALINYHVALHLKEHNIHDTDLLTKLFDSSTKINQNKPKKVLGEEGYFASIYEKNQDKEWIIAYLKYLVSKDMSSKAVELIDEFKLSGTEISLILLEADLSHDITRFESDYQNLLKDLKSGNAKLLKLLIRYNLELNTDKSILLILSQFAKYSHMSPEIEELIAYTKLVNSIRTSTPLNETAPAKSINHLAILILSSSDLSHMMHLYERSPSLVRHHESEFITALFDNLIKISSKYPEMNKLNKVLKFTKLIGLNVLEISHFSQLVKLMKNNLEMLGLLVSRLINQGKFTDVLNFYFMEVRLFDIKDKKTVLKEMYNTLKEVGDVNNVEHIEEFCKENGLKI
ncbi:Ribonuclease P protein component mitochondrial [Spathaspora sp. JA1]|nr:Ribonuclease P protein component mitochondrial [Spathaspora sp. JA1]